MIAYGDSYTSGENNNGISFADYLGIQKQGVSGSCLGGYSIYPVEDSLLSTFRPTTDTVLLEYGINDAASLLVGFASMDTVKVSAAKAVDIMCGADVFFLALTEDEEVLKSFCQRYVKYLNEEYLKGFYTVTATDFQSCYERFCTVMRTAFPVKYMLPQGFKDFDTDGIHPTDKGYKAIADNLSRQLWATN